MYNNICVNCSAPELVQGGLAFASPSSPLGGAVGSCKSAGRRVWPSFVLVRTLLQALVSSKSVSKAANANVTYIVYKILFAKLVICSHRLYYVDSNYTLLPRVTQSRSKIKMLLRRICPLDSGLCGII